MGGLDFVKRILLAGVLCVYEPLNRSEPVLFVLIAESVVPESKLCKQW